MKTDTEQSRQTHLEHMAGKYIHRNPAPDPYLTAGSVWAKQLHLYYTLLSCSNNHVAEHSYAA